jgi:hypothetical protein
VEGRGKVKLQARHRQQHHHLHANPLPSLCRPPGAPRPSLSAFLFHLTLGPLKISWGSDVDAAAKRMLGNDEFLIGGELNEQVASDVRSLWADEGIQKAFSRYAEFQLNDSAK